MKLLIHYPCEVGSSHIVW